MKYQMMWRAAGGGIVRGRGGMRGRARRGRRGRGGDFKLFSFFL